MGVVGVRGGGGGAGKIPVALSGSGASQAGLEPTGGLHAPRGTSDHPPSTSVADGEVWRTDWNRVFSKEQEKHGCARRMNKTWSCDSCVTLPCHYFPIKEKSVKITTDK